ncbi:hypothetical protein BTVI_08910 [Pitangus sulphuratus]|nr:hypothetical protein BTVI_08910 [Pitangus sulphuratus]
MKFKKGECKVLHLDQDNPKYKYRLVAEWIESNPAKKDLGGVDGREDQHELAKYAHRPESYIIRGMTSSPLLCSCDTPP